MKGVSSIMATVLMVAVTIAAAVVAYSWLMSVQASVQAEASRGAGTVGKERITVTAVRCDAGKIFAYVRNLGDEKIKGTFTVIVEDASTGIVLHRELVDNITLDAGSEVELNTAIVQKLGNDCVVDSTNSEHVLVKVVTPGGSVASMRQRVGVAQ